jgi:hypothetical protein
MSAANPTHQQGFVTLISVLVLGAVGVAVVTSLLLLGVGNSRSSFTAEQSLQARGFADACAETALQQIRANSAFIGTNTLAFGSNSCTYTVTNNGGTTRAIVSNGTVGTIVRRVNISVATVLPVTISLWQEVAN